METANFKVPFTKIKAINAHPNPEVHSLQIASVYDFQVIIRKDTLKVGDNVIYAPVDSILNETLESMIFPPESKMKLSDSRVRQVRIQKFPSQGLLIDVDLAKKYLQAQGFDNIVFTDEQDVSKLLNITKFEPPAPKEMVNGKPITSARRLAEHPQFHTYNGLTNIKWGSPFAEDEEVQIQLKLHGTNARFGNLKKTPKTLWEKFLKLIKMLPEYEVRYGSNNVDITAKNGKSGYYKTDVYGKAFEAVKAHEKVLPNEVIYGEIIGEGIQKNYHYGHKEPCFVLFDVKVFNEFGTWTWLNPEEVEAYAKERGFKMVPVLYRGIYTKEIAESLVSGADPYYPQHKVREGIVIKSKNEYNDVMSSSNKKARKMINPQYLDSKDNSDFH